MNIHDKAFYICAFFISGVFLASAGVNFMAVVFGGLLLAVCFIFYKKFIFSALALFIIFGAFYYQVFSYFQEETDIIFDSKTEFTGIIIEISKSSASQKLVLDLKAPYSGKIQMNVRRYPDFRYGDLVKAIGIIKKPSIETKDYLAKNGIFGTVSFPEIGLVKSGEGNFIKAGLLKFKDRIINGFENSLPAEKAAFLSGLILGEQEDFSKELKEKMSLSGTTHLVALSGYNISVISIAILAIFGAYFSRSISFYLSILVIILFVLMTGAEASVVRAAIMGIIAIMAKETQRIFSIRNAITIAAFLMILYNPKVLAFDLGFQLSFAALLGIVYLSPVFKKIFRFENPGFLSWKENAVTTVSAQLAVIPLLLGKFGIFSLTSIFANVLILGVMPMTMGMGFLMAGLGLFSDFLAGMAGLIMNLFLSYELWVIDLFSRIAFPIAAESFGYLAATVYYLLLTGFIHKFDR